MDIQKLVEQTVKESIAAAVQTKLGAYGSPLDAIIADVIKQHDGPIRSLLLDSIGSAFRDDGFRGTVASAVRAKLARTLIERFGGELEKQVNQLKSDPLTRARITTAIDEIVKAGVK